MSVRYKFTNDLQYSTLPCDGFDVSLRDLKKAVVRAKKLGRITEFDLIVTNEQTSQVYDNDEDLIPKNSTLVFPKPSLLESRIHGSRWSISRISGEGHKIH